MIQKTLAALLAMALLATQGCVGAKVYRAEKNARMAGDAREKVLVQELLDRKKETANLTKMVGELNRLIGRQETEIKDLNAELAIRTQSMGESASKLSMEKSALEKQLASTAAELDTRQETILRIKSVQDKRKTILAELEMSLNKAFQAQKEAGVQIAADGETVFMLLPDKLLFDPTGLQVSASGKTVLMSLAEFLAARPSLRADVVAFTDNVLPPKEKTLKDTWDWSLQRATNVLRLMIREFNVNANQLTPIGKGEFYPLTSNETPEGRAKNRRTLVVFRAVLPGVPVAE
jgi:chemotaxis protein MotB